MSRYVGSMAEFSKSGYLAGLQCRRRLWQQRHAPERASPPDAEQLERMALGSEIGAAARGLFPGGVLIEELDFALARARTDELLARGGAPALFEPAFCHEGVRIRVDVLEPLAAGAFGLREVKSSTQVKDEHLDDVVVQLFVLRGAGLRVPSVELILIDPGFERGPGDLDWSRYLVRHDVTEDAEFLLADLAGRVGELRAMLDGPEPGIGPGPWCRSPHPCEFVAHCSRGLPADRVARLPRLRSHQAHELVRRGVTRIGEIPDDFKLSGPQQRAREAWRTGAPVVSAALAPGLAGAGRSQGLRLRGARPRHLPDRDRGRRCRARRCGAADLHAAGPEPAQGPLPVAVTGTSRPSVTRNRVGESG